MNHFQTVSFFSSYILTTHTHTHTHTYIYIYIYIYICVCVCVMSVWMWMWRRVKAVGRGGIDMATQVQILDETVCIGKGMYPSILLSINR